ncbi:MAG: hypothetical protein ACRYGR_07140 [Janthinobacterium lividum]
MPNLDVSELLLDPDFCQAVIVERYAQSVTSQGLAATKSGQAQISAAVVPAGSLDLNRGADTEIIKGRIIAYTQFPLTAGSDGIGADVLFWQNRRYTVSSVDEYTQFGVGFVMATADLFSTHNQAG